MTSPAASSRDEVGRARARSRRRARRRPRPASAAARPRRGARPARGDRCRSARRPGGPARARRSSPPRIRSRRCSPARRSPSPRARSAPRSRRRPRAARRPGRRRPGGRGRESRRTSSSSAASARRAAPRRWSAGAGPGPRVAVHRPSSPPSQTSGMAGRKLARLAKIVSGAGIELKARNACRRLEVDLAREARAARSSAFSSEAKESVPPACAVVERLDPEAVAGQHQAATARVPDRQREHPPQRLDELVARAPRRGGPGPRCRSACESGARAARSSSRSSR